jgi:hypothetical protein
LRVTEAKVSVATAADDSSVPFSKPVRMLLRYLGFKVNAFGFNPQTELHAFAVDIIGQGFQSVWEFALVLNPIAQPVSEIAGAATFIPAGVNDENLATQIGSDVNFAFQNRFVDVCRPAEPRVELHPREVLRGGWTQKFFLPLMQLLTRIIPIASEEQQEG